MKINPNGINFLDTAKIAVKPASVQNNEKSFLDFLKDSLAEVNSLQNTGDAMSISFAAGDPNVDIHNLMLALEEANVALQLTIEVRNKLIESYQEIMRMQV